MNKPIDPRHKILGHVDVLAAWKAGGKPAPINVEIDLSNRCSLGCEWCHFAYTHTRGPLAGKVPLPMARQPGGDLMDTVLAYKIVGQLKAAGVRSITWTGGGEPTLHPSFDDIITHCHDCAIDQGLYTHGGHISLARASLLKSTLKWVYVSLDECTREAYEASKGVDRFDDALAGIRNLIAADGFATVGIGFLLHPGNLRDVGTMVSLGQLLGVDYIQFRPAIAYDQGAPGRAMAADWIPDAITAMRRYKDSPGVLVDEERFKMYQDWRRGYSTCHWAAVQTVITPNGKVWRCVNKREHEGAALGDLSVDSFAEIWSKHGGACKVDAGCRVMCRGHIGNITLDAVMGRGMHRNFI